MKKSGKQYLTAGVLSLALFAVWTWLIQTVDVQPAGETGMAVGFAALNSLFHSFTGVHMWIYSATDWLGLVPVFICLIFAGVGIVQLVRRKSLLKVDLDILLLGVYYVLTIFGYLIFEMIPINYRPIFIEGRLEASYPSSTTLLVLCVMPTLVLQVQRRIKQEKGKKIIVVFSMLFSTAMVVGRLCSGVHWLTDIVGAILLSAGLVYLYRAVVVLWCEK